jgi:c-di-GMP-binding flagellar brake protein YcgR
MGDEKRERRGGQRIFFSVEDEVKGTFSFSGFQRGSLTGAIINLSETGLGLILSKDDSTKKLGKGDYLILTQLNGIKGLESVSDIRTEIKWIVDNPTLKFIGCGCEFHNVPEAMREAIQTFIDTWLFEKLGESFEDSPMNV